MWPRIARIKIVGYSVWGAIQQMAYCRHRRLSQAALARGYWVEQTLATVHWLAISCARCSTSSSNKDTLNTCSVWSSKDWCTLSQLVLETVAWNCPASLLLSATDIRSLPLSLDRFPQNFPRTRVHAGGVSRHMVSYSRKVSIKGSNFPKNPLFRVPYLWSAYWPRETFCDAYTLSIP